MKYIDDLYERINDLCHLYSCDLSVLENHP